jgi:D-aspartate ligase
MRPLTSYLPAGSRATSRVLPDNVAACLGGDHPPTQRRLPPPRAFLLTMGNHLGTLAAARDLGRHGIPVVLADVKRSTLTAHSRFVGRTLNCPGLDEPEAWAQWALSFGQREPGHVLYPTSDDVCWLLDKHGDALSRYFYMYQPPGGWHEILDKKRLYAHCEALGIDHPEAWTPAQALAGPAGMHYPVLVKPSTTTGTRNRPKGVVAHSLAELRAALEQFRHKSAHPSQIHAHDPGLGDPIVQEFHPKAAQHIYSLAGFYAPDQNIYLLRASEKVLQYPLTVGVGLCFESRPVHSPLGLQLRRLIDVLGYRGAFEVEFIHLRADNRFLLIDFNPRFYGQMGFDIARGLPIARLCYLAAIGDWAELQRLAAAAQHWEHKGPWHFRHRWLLKLYVTTHWLGGNLSRQERRNWLQWANCSPFDDPVLAADDPAPADVARRQTWQALLRHPRSTLRTYFRR